MSRGRRLGGCVAVGGHRRCDRARLPAAADRRALRAHLAGSAARPALEPGRQGRRRRQPQDEPGRAGADPRLRHTDRASDRDAALPGALACDHVGRAAARAAAGGRGHRAARGVRTPRAARLVSERLGITLPFTQAAVTVAVAYVASPLYVRQAIASFEAVNPDLVAASRTLGVGPTRTFARVVFPLAGGGLVAGLALSFARGLGEFGATIMFAGSLQGVTQTLPLAIYAQFDQDFDSAVAMSAVLVLLQRGSADVAAGRSLMAELVLDEIIVPLGLSTSA